MRVDCYNATECQISDVEIGDTFYGKDNYLYIRINPSEYLVDDTGDLCYAVRLDIGELYRFPPFSSVILADTKVVANIKGGIQ